MSQCFLPQDNFPFRADTFQLVSQLASRIKAYSSRYAVPPVAVAGAIADEYNTRVFPKSFIDWFQDDILLNWMPDAFITFDARLGFNSKLFNATKHDIGKGNIKLATAKRLYDAHRQEFINQSMSYEDLVDYIRSDEGTVHLAALVIRKAQRVLRPYVGSYDAAIREAVYVTWYKQGPSYLSRFQNRSASANQHDLLPGEGCRTWHQRSKFLQALGISE